MLGAHWVLCDVQAARAQLGEQNQALLQRPQSCAHSSPHSAQGLLTGIGSPLSVAHVAADKDSERSSWHHNVSAVTPR
jgi:hypothetical protein